MLPRIWVQNHFNNINIRRRFNLCIVWVNEASLRRYEITPILVVPLSFPHYRGIFVSYYLSGRFPVVLIIPELPAWPLVGSASVGSWELCIPKCNLFGQRQGVGLDERRFARTLHCRRCLGRCYPYLSACDDCGLLPHVFHKNVYRRAVHVVGVPEADCL